MKTILMLALGLFGSLCQTQAQGSKPPPNVLYIIHLNGKTIKTNHIIIYPTDVTAMDIPSKTEVMKDFGPLDEDFVMHITLKSAVVLATLPDLFNKYKIDTKYRGLPVKVDNQKIMDPANMLIQVDKIISVTVKDNYLVIATNIAQLNTERLKQQWATN